MTSSTTEELRVAGQEGLDLVNKLSDVCHAKYRSCAPLSPSFIDAAHAIILTSTTKGGFGFGFTRGHGIALVKLPSLGPNAPTQWSAPIFVSIACTEFGLCLGYQNVLTFMLAMSPKLIKQLLEGGHSVMGVDQSMVAFTPQIQHRSDVIALSSGQVDVASISHAGGFMIDFSLAGGKMSVDDAKMQRVYGSGMTAAKVAAGAVAAPAELSELYARLNSLTQDTRMRMSPTRVGASLERMTAGYDPDRRIVGDSGEALESSAHAGRSPGLTKPVPTSSVATSSQVDSDHSFGINVGMARRSAAGPVTPTHMAQVPRTAVAPAPSPA